MLKNSILSSISGRDSKQYIDDIFSTYTYTGNGATQTINNGIDLAGKGGMVWCKRRDAALDHSLTSSAIGTNNALLVNLTDALALNNSRRTFLSNGFSIDTSNGRVNTGAAPYASWTFRNADKFYNHAVVTKTTGSNATVNFASLGTLGMVRVKRTDASGSWYIWHRSLSAGQLLIGETTAAAATLGHVTVSGTTVTLVNGVIADGTYLVEAFAHDAGADGIIQCGSFTTDGSGNVPATILGFEPQFMLWRASSRVENWKVLDSMRGWTASNTMAELRPNTSDAEVANTNFMQPTATGFGGGTLAASNTYIYLAIRRPNKPPTTGAQVYNAIARTGTGAAATVTGVGFAPDVIFSKARNSSFFNGSFNDKIRGKSRELAPDVTSPEFTYTTGLSAYLMDGYSVGADDSAGTLNANGTTYINHFFRRSVGFFDEVCDTGAGAAHAIQHNLTKAPELIIRKSRSAGTQWEVWHSALAATEKLVLNSTAAKSTDTAAWNSTVPTASQFTVGTGANVNANAATFVTYLFATLAGISKVGSYTGNGSTQTIDCGFSTGARFILIKRTDSIGDWYIWDSVRGIVSANDPHLSLNTTAAEVTTDDSVDPASQGFSVNQNTTTNINVNLASYIFLAIA